MAVSQTPPLHARKIPSRALGFCDTRRRNHLDGAVWVASGGTPSAVHTALRRRPADFLQPS